MGRGHTTSKGSGKGSQVDPRPSKAPTGQADPETGSGVWVGRGRAMTKVLRCPWPALPLQLTSILGKQNPVREESGIIRFSLTCVFEPEARPQLSGVFYRSDLKGFIQMISLKTA